MKLLNGIGALCALGLLVGDAIVGASIGKVVFHAVLLVVSLVLLYMTEER